jgi:hypothetical protein
MYVVVSLKYGLTVNLVRLSRSADESDALQVHSRIFVLARRLMIVCTVSAFTLTRCAFASMYHGTAAYPACDVACEICNRNASSFACG